jgi:hypothetical protein
MHAPFRKFVPLALLITIVSTASSCSDSDDPSPTAPTTHVTATMTAEPMVVTPEFVPNASCRTVPAFRTSLVVVVAGDRDLILRNLRFSFTDRLGGTTLPVVIAVVTTSVLTSVPNSMPVPMPNTSPITIPGTMPIPGSSAVAVPGSPAVDGVVVLAGTSRRLPLVLEFGCGVPSAGSLTVIAEMMDRDGTPRNQRTTVRLGD